MRVLTLLLLLFVFTIHAQNKPWQGKFEPIDNMITPPNTYRNASGAPTKAYWQQRADYKIMATINEKTNTLSGEETITYYNNSPDDLSYLWIQLEQNVNKKENEDFGATNNSMKDSITTRQMQFLTRAIDFPAGYSIKSVIDDNEKNMKTMVNNTMMKVKLNTILKSGETTKFSIVWSYPITDRSMYLLSREGYEYFPEDDNTVYLIAHWFPRMAVYNDTEGWQNQQFQKLGEFALEFGDYEVEITVPEDHIIASTGELQNSESVLTKTQQKRLEQAKKSFDKPIMIITKEEAETNEKQKSTKQKTWKFNAKNVRDFAFASSRKFIWDAQAVKLPTNTVMAMSYYPKEGLPVWQESSTKAIMHALEVYSEATFDYPYPVCISVNTSNIGMEFPMISFNGGRPINGIISDNAKQRMIGTIIHEVGHNWFYGILGSNERDHPWMDEGWNSYMDSRYMSTYYKYNYNTKTEYLAYLYEAKKHEDQPIESRSQDLSSINYYICGYAKPTMSFRYLQEYLGAEELDRILHKYFETWKFKHPSPTDLRAVFKAESSKDLDWFFDNVINSTKHIDYASTGHRCCNQHNKASITIKNKGQIPAPVSLSALDEENNVIEKIWVAPLARGTDTTIEMTSENAVAYKIDAEEEMPEINRNNNEIRNYGLFKKGEPVKVKLLADFENPNKPRINILPLLGFNLYDGIMIGAAIYNLPVPKPEWEYSVLPFFSTFTLSATGMGELKHNSYIKKHRFSHGVGFKTFHKRLKRYTEERPFEYKERFYKITPYIEFELTKKSDISKERHRFRFEHAFILEESARLDVLRDSSGSVSEYLFLGKETSWRSTHRLSHYYTNKQAQAPMSLLTTLEYANYDDLIDGRQHYLKLSLEAKFKFMYSRLWGVDLRIFTGGFLMHTDRSQGQFPLLLIAGNRTDYHYDNHIMGRQESENALAQQVAIREGGFKTAIEPIIGAGASNAFIFAMNLKSDIPIKLPFRTKFFKLKPFLDIGYHHITDVTVTNPSFADGLMISGGIMIDVWDELIGIYLPLFGTDTIENKVKSFAGKEFYRRITFSFNLSRMKPSRVVDELGF